MIEAAILISSLCNVILTGLALARACQAYKVVRHIREEQMKETGTLVP